MILSQNARRRVCGLLPTVLAMCRQEAVLTIHTCAVRVQMMKIPVNVQSLEFSARLSKAVLVGSSALLGLSFLPTILAAPALAHHPLGGHLPGNAIEGFFSGLAHPVLGPDHFLFVLAIGTLAATRSRGWLLPVVFVATSFVGSLLHLAEVNLPLLELMISGSLLLSGGLLARSQRAALGLMVGLGAIAGLFHGYAYAEAIFGAEMTPLTAYLAGLATVQLTVALGVRAAARRFVEASEQPGQMLRYAGFTFFGAGIAFLAGVLA